MELVNNTINNPFYHFETPSLKFTNIDYILKLNNNHNLKFFKDELTIKYVGKAINAIDYATVQANKPINKFNPIFYFEIEILEDSGKKDITIGYSDKDFILNKQCGTTSKSYGYNCDGKMYHDKNKGDHFGPKFKANDVVGCGYYFSKNSIMYTLNGKFLGYAFKNVEYNNFYPTISLHNLNDKVTVNFGKKNFLFDIEGFYISQYKENLNDILKLNININDLEYVVREYLVHSGYQESFNAMELDNIVDIKENIIDKKLSQRKESMEIDDDEYDRARKLSIDDVSKEPELKKRTLSFMMERMNDESDKKGDIFIIMNYLEERKIIQNMITEKNYENALIYFEKSFKNIKHDIKYKKIILCLRCLQYFETLENNDYNTAYGIFNDFDSSYWEKDITIFLYDKDDILTDYNLESLSILLCYDNISNSEFSFFFDIKQTSLISNQINSLILEMAGISSESILEKILKQQSLSGHLFRQIKNSYGEKIIVKI